MTSTTLAAGWPLLVGLGCLSGFLSGLLGIGGGAIIVPALVAALPMLGVAGADLAKIAIATSVALIIPTAIASAQQHGARGAIDWPILALFGPSMMAGAFAAAFLAGGIDARLLCLIFVVYALYAAYGIAMPRAARRSSPEAGQSRPGLMAVAAVGVTGGALSSLIGLGNAFYSIPFMARFIAMQTAIGTAAALNIPLAIAGAAGYAITGAPSECGAGCLGYIYLPAVAAIGITAVLAAPVGARLTHVLPVMLLRRLFAGLLVLGAGDLALKTLPLAEAPAYAAGLIERWSLAAEARGPIAAASPACLDDPTSRLSDLVGPYGPRRAFAALAGDCPSPTAISAALARLGEAADAASTIWDPPLLVLTQPQTPPLEKRPLRQPRLVVKPMPLPERSGRLLGRAPANAPPGLFDLLAEPDRSRRQWSEALEPGS